ncbi:hypothetical protein DF186_25685, partial [Enterococcus hirae]
ASSRPTSGTKMTSNPELALGLQVASQAQDLPPEQRFSEWAQAALHGHAAGELTIRIVDEQESRELNLAYRGKDRPT